MKKKKTKRTGKANFRQNRKHSDKIDDYKYDSKGSSIMRSDSAEKENRADIELRKLKTGRGVFPSSPDAIKKGNTNDRRYR